MAFRNNTPDLTGKTFGQWTVLERAPSPTKETRAYWLCRCSCGGEYPRRARDLIQGKTSRCQECYTSSLGTDMTGRVFGSWTVLEVSHASAGRKLYWVCRCVCGRVKPVDGSTLRRGKSTQCGSCRTRKQRAAEKEKTS